jgi:hypothetical protein
MRMLLVAPLLVFILAAPSLADDREVFHPSKASFEKFPREVEGNSNYVYQVRLKSGYFAPVMAVTRPNGSTEYIRPLRDLGSRKYEFEVPFAAGRGEYRVELIVDSKSGDTTAAQFTIWAGIRKPDELPASEGPRPEGDYAPEPKDESTIRLERKLFGHMNAFREKQGLPPYRWLEQAAQLARSHLLDYLEMKPRPKRLTHLIPGHGSIADRFEETLAWPNTIRKFPIQNPVVSPEAVGYCSEALAWVVSLDWLFNEYFLRESAFRAPVISKYPTHAAVGIIRDPDTGKLTTATVYVQLNSTRVMEDLEEEWEETGDQEADAREPGKRAMFLRRLGRMSDPRSLPLYGRRLDSKEPVVRAAALDALFLNDPKKAGKWVERQVPRLARARREDSFKPAIPILQTMAAVQYDLPTRLRGESELTELSGLATRVLGNALKLLELGDVEFARETLGLIAARFEGLPEAEVAAAKLEELNSGR